VHGDRERFDDGGEIERERGRNCQQVGGRKVDEIAEETGSSGIAQEADVGADVVAAGAAELAVVAVEGGFEGRAITAGPAADAGAGLQDGARRLVTKNHGVLARGIANCAFGVGMEIASANAYGVHPHLDFAGAGVFDRYFVESELTLRD